jgi:hypothetical protein
MQNVAYIIYIYICRRKHNNAINIYNETYSEASFIIFVATNGVNKPVLMHDPVCLCPLRCFPIVKYKCLLYTDCPGASFR